MTGPPFPAAQSVRCWSAAGVAPDRWVRINVPVPAVSLSASSGGSWDFPP
jgi:hypothetical protein